MTNDCEGVEMNQDRIDYLEQQEAIMNERKAVQFHDRLVAALRALAQEIDATEWGSPWKGRPHAIMDNARALLAEIEANNEGKPR